MTIIPRKLFLLDGIGALLSAFLLGVILANFESTFGMSKKVLYFLAVLPCFFAIFSFTSYFRNVKNWRPYLKAIAIANLTYCCLTAFLVFYFYEQLTALGVAYFLLEIAVIVILVYIELKTAFANPEQLNLQD